MWFFDTHKYEHGEQIVRWTFLFAAPEIFRNFQSVNFSFLHLLIGFILIVVLTLLGNGLSFIVKMEAMNTKNWSLYGRLIQFAAKIIYNLIVATQIWTGFVLAKFFVEVFEQNNDLYVFSIFVIALIAFLAVITSALPKVNELR